MGSVVAGIDVGGPKKGFHAVALKEGRFFRKEASTSADAIAGWCRSIGARVIAVDAPCAWRAADGRARSAELEMAAEGITCYFTPTEEKARAHAFYAWMLSGQKLYSALAGVSGPIVFETFPHAVACALSGRVVSAKSKKTIRRELLSRLNLAVAALANMDEIDAALCAVAAHSFVQDDFKKYGDAAGGFIIVPRIKELIAGTEAPEAGERKERLRAQIKQRKTS